MVPQRQHLSCASLVLGLAVALASTFLGCGFESPAALETPEGLNAILTMAPVRSLDAADRWTVYEVPDKLNVQHGYGCLQQGFAASADGQTVGFRIQDTAAVPRAFADAGTVLLNGWDVRYTNGDHHVKGLGAAVFNITETRTEDQFALHWEAGGMLSDRNGDDGYTWCYRYTLVFWRRGAFNAVVFPQHDVSTTFVHQASADDGTALLDLPAHFPNPPYGGPGAVVPRGFGLAWHKGDTDHHVLQAGFDLGPATPVLAGTELTWTSQMILKDNSPVDTYSGAAFVTVLSGTSVALWQPPAVWHWTDAGGVEEPTDFTLSPDTPAGCDWLDGREEYLESYTVDKVPFDYAVPVLTGWDLSYVCTDHHVERIGAYLVEFAYVKDPAAATGTLNYTVFSTLRDDSDNGHAARYKVSILGLNAMEGR
jgi:hypothetical protein